MRRRKRGKKRRKEKDDDGCGEALSMESPGEDFLYVHSKRGGAEAWVSIRGNSKTQPGSI